MNVNIVTVIVCRRDSLEHSEERMDCFYQRALQQRDVATRLGDKEAAVKTLR